jgi:DNA modification methylase
MSPKPPFETNSLWYYPEQSYGSSQKGDPKFEGVTPAYIIWNLIERYTKPGDLVIDPMAGSGTTIDVCEEEGRKVIGYDISPAHPKVIENDSRKIPLEDNSVDMVFVDSSYVLRSMPHLKQADIGRISPEDPEYYEELEKVGYEIYRILKPGKTAAWLIGDEVIREKFVPMGFSVYLMLVGKIEFELVDIICVAVKPQKSKLRFQKKKTSMLRGFKYLFVVKKPGE